MRLLLLPLAMLALLCCAAAAAVEPLLAVVVPAAPGHLAPSEQDINLIFKRRKQMWRDGSRIQPVNLPADNALRRRFSRAVLKLSPDALEEYWNEQYFHGLLPPHVVASESAMARFVAETEGAIGYLPYCSVDRRLRVVLLVTADGRVVVPGSGPDSVQACGVSGSES
jgi:hypothetical protein